MISWFDLFCVFLLLMVKVFAVPDLSIWVVTITLWLPFALVGVISLLGAVTVFTIDSIELLNQIFMRLK